METGKIISNYFYQVEIVRDYLSTDSKVCEKATFLFIPIILSFHYLNGGEYK